MSKYWVDICGYVLKNYSLSDKQLIAMVALAVSAYAAFVSIYNSASGITSDIAQCEQLNIALAKKRQVQFIVIIIISCIAIVLGIFLSFLMRKSNWLFLPIAISLTGLLGLIYSIGIKANNKVQMGLSITLFVFFLIYGIAVGIGSNNKPTIIAK